MMGTVEDEMKNSPQAYAARFQRVLDYIQEHLDGDVSVERLARVACFSPFHFQRQFTALAGISVGRLTQLLRLKRASYHLVFGPEQRITDIALDAGFENAESFSRAFKAAFGQTPSDFRAAPRWKPWLEKTTFNHLGGRHTMQVDIVNFEETRLAVLEHRGDPALRNDSLQKFIEWRKSRGLGLDSSETYNLVYDDPLTTAAQDYRFDVGVTVQKPVGPDDHGIIDKIIPAGRCAMLRHLGSSDNIDQSVRYLYEEWLPASGEEVRDFPLFFHRVKLFPAQVPEHEQITDIYLPLR